MGVIFDLDQTIVDSTVAAALRKERRWQQVYSQIPRFTVYEGILDVFDFLAQNAIDIAIVSTSPRPYCERVVAHIKMRCSHLVAYHDAKPIKPHPAPMQKALQLLKMQPKQVISVGDRAIDIESSHSAGIKSVGCLWGSEEKELLRAAKPGYLIGKPSEFIPIAREFFEI